MRSPFDNAEAARAALDAMRPQTGAHPLDDVENYIGRFVSYPSEHARVAHALWIAHTHFMDEWESTPRIAFLSPEPGSGKSRALEVSEPLVPRPVEAVNVTPAYLFRKVGSDEGRPTILFDEIDTVFGPKAKDANEEIRGLLNAGHRRHGVAGRCVLRGNQVVTEEIPAYCAVAVAGLGSLPDTILTRSVIVRMRRRAPGEVVEQYRRRLHFDQGAALRERLKQWAEHVAPTIGDPWPTMPPEVADRDADVWESLIAIADQAGGEWPRRAREAAVLLVADSKATTPSLGVRLLADLRRVFGTSEVMSTDSILRGLCDLDEAPWGDLRGRPLDARGLSHRLSAYGIKPKTVRVGTHTPKGYARADLWDAWQRYLPSHQESATSATPATSEAAHVAHVAHVAQFQCEARDGAGDAPEFVGPPDLRRKAREAVMRHAEANDLPQRQIDAWLQDAIDNPMATLDVLAVA